jgi:spore coat polysaccharide biosynthesis protein SpsF
MRKDLHIVTVMQTRMGSTRLPGKAMLPLAGKPLFVQQANRMKAATLLQTIVVATSTDAADDIIETTCEVENLPCYRGHATDLLDRHYQAALLHNADVVIKIPSDCPLIDPAVIDEVVGYYLDHVDDFDFVSNLHPATWPDGNDVEIMTMDALSQAWLAARKELEREHTTPYIWENPSLFRIGNVSMAEDYSMRYRFTIDYLEDYQFIQAVYAALYDANPLFTVSDIIDLLHRQPDIYAINAAFAGVNWYRHHLDELTTISAHQTKKLSNEI